MPKKFNGGVNQKAAKALARKAAEEELKIAKKMEEAERVFWEDNDKHVVRKIKRREEKEKKKLNVLEKKAEKKMLLEQEMIQMKSKKSKKLTISEIQKISSVDTSKNLQDKRIIQSPQVLEENNNRFVDEINARNVTEAIAALNFKEVVPNLKGYKSFEKNRLEEVRKNNPTLRLSQIKQIIFKEWERSNLNPLNKT